MEFLFVIAIIILIALVMPKQGKTAEVPISENMAIEKKICPPHQWIYQDIIDQNGAVQDQKMVCKVCGPIRTDGAQK